MKNYKHLCEKNKTMILSATKENEQFSSPLHLSVDSGISPSDDELTIHVKSHVTCPSPMPDNVKKMKREGSEGLMELFTQVLREKGEDIISELKVTDNEIELSSLSSMTLHSFILKAEELGKCVTYEKSFRVKITD